MKLLLDQNLSYRLVAALHKEFPDSQHVRDVGLKDATDEAVWNYAAQHGLTIVTKDADFISAVSSSDTLQKWFGSDAGTGPPR